MLVSMLSVDPLDMLCTEPSLALGPICGDLNLEDLVMSFLLMCDEKFNFFVNAMLSLSQFLWGMA